VEDDVGARGHFLVASQGTEQGDQNPLLSVRRAGGQGPSQRIEGGGRGAGLPPQRGRPHQENPVLIRLRPGEEIILTFRQEIGQGLGRWP
jgi:hypothetical protein